MEIFCITAFCAVLGGSVALGLPVIGALIVGLAIFWGCGLYRGHSPSALARMCVDGNRTAGGVITTMFLIGALTALWRAGGTIPYMIAFASRFMHPASMPLAAFVLCSCVSMLIGTSFGTAATMGSICVAMAVSSGASVFWTGGAVLAGAFYGDRASPVSSSLLLVSSLTGTDTYADIRAMMKTSAIPTVAACLIYAAAGAATNASGGTADPAGIFAREFSLSPICAAPALIVIALAVARVRMRTVIIASAGAAFACGMIAEGRSAYDLARAALMGYTSADPEISRMMSGGGVSSMLGVVAILCVSSCYAGIFDGTGMLSSIKSLLARVGRVATPYGAKVAASFATGSVTCNQTLAIMLTHSLCDDEKEDRVSAAVDLADSAVITSPLIPWSIGAIVPLSSAGADISCIPAACFLWLIPLYRVARELIKRRQS